MPPLYILRHGETTWNRQGRLQGRFDAPLTQVGLAQARTQRRILLGRDLSGYTVITSPQGRAQKTAKIALAGRCGTPYVDPALREIGLGQWAGCHRKDLQAQSGSSDRFDVYERAPKGEGFEALRRRCHAFIRSRSRPSVLITHGVTSRMLRVVLTGQPTEALGDIGGGQGMVYFVENGKQTALTLRA